MQPSSPAAMRLAFALVVCLFGGVVLAGLAFPLIGGLGLVGQSVADDMSPQKPPPLQLAQSSTILDRNGKRIATLFTENRVPVKLADVPDHARNAVIAIEDNRFYDHEGVDVKGTVRALARNSSAGSVQQGGSTLTQQYVKNMLISSASTKEAQEAAIQRSLRRKIQEARYALYLEDHMSKDEILEAYLNIAYYGNGVYGIGTAANHYFSVPVQRLTVAQAALLAGMVQNPRRYDPVDNPRAAVARRNLVLERMTALGHIAPAQERSARKQGLRLKVTKVLSGCEAPGVRAPFFCDYVRRYLENGPAGAALGSTRQERQQRLLSGGLTIRTTLDPKVQAAAERSVNRHVPPKDPFRAIAAADTVEPGTGAVRAMAVDRTFGDKKGQTKVNYALGGSAGFQAGSTFKVFVLARALQMGISPGLTLHAPQRYCPRAFPYIAGDGRCGPSNAGDSESGVFNMVTATWDSVNTYFIQLEERTGLVGPPKLAESLGVRTVDGTFKGGSLPQDPSFVLGPYGVSPLAMASAYAAFAAKGTYCPPHPVTAITDSQGKPLPLKTEPCTKVLETDVADDLTAMLRGVIDGPGKHTGARAAIGRPAAGKTGTTNDSRAAWFVGYTPQLATAVWVGKSTPTPMKRVTINGRYYSQVYGGGIPAMIFSDLMREAHKGLPVERFTGGDLDMSGRGGGLTIPGLRPPPARGPGGPATLAPTQRPAPRPTAVRTVAPRPNPKPKPPKPNPKPTSQPSPTKTSAPSPQPTATQSPDP